MVRAVGLPPGWLRAPQDPGERVADLFAKPAPVAVASAATVLLGLVVCALIAARRRRLDVVAASALALALMGALAIVTASFPNTGFQIFGYGYSARWANIAGMFAWLALAWSAATLSPARWRPTPSGTPALRALSALGAVLIVAVVVAVAQGPDTQEPLYGPIRTVVEELDADLTRPRSVRVDGSNLQFGTTMVFALRRRGASVGTDLGVQFGRKYLPEGRRYEQIVDIREGTAVARGAAVVTRVRVAPPNGRTYTVSLRPGAAAPAR